MDFFNRPDIQKMIDLNDREGLYQCLNHRHPATRLQAAQALAEMNDGTGWRVLTEWVGYDNEPDIQEGAAAILGELGARSPGDAHRVVPALGAALKLARDETAAVIRDALLQVGGPEAEEALRLAGYTPSVEEPVSEVSEFEAHFVRPVLPDTQDIEFLTAEAHLNTAVDLRENELAERGLVECSLALWLQPDWAYAWYLRGVLFEDLERPYEAWLAYRQAVEIDPRQADAIEAMQDLEEENRLIPLDPSPLAEAAGSLTWQDRRDAAAGLGVLALKNPDLVKEYIGLLVDLLDDEEREVRHAAIHALGFFKDNTTADLLANRQESSWLLRFALIDSVSRLKQFDALITVLESEMERMMDRNPSFSSFKDPLIEVEYERMLEIGVLALERTEDLEGLLTTAEGNVWVEVEGEVEEEEPQEEERGIYILNDENIEDELFAGEDFEVDEDLSSYVDEVSRMVCLALNRVARRRLPKLDGSTLERLAKVPDLTLVDLEQWEQRGEETGNTASMPMAVVYDLSGLREAARAEIDRRGG